MNAGGSAAGTGRPSRSAPAQRSRSAAPSASRASVNALAAALDEAAARPVAAVESFAELGLPAALATALTRNGIAAPFAIQTRVLPDALAGRDILGRAGTGSGKTLAFGLPALARLAAEPRPTRIPNSPRALILVPTRELARQVADVLEPLARPLRLNVMTVVGGLSMGRQIDQLRRGADVLVATPGRLIDLMERRSCSLDRVEVSVLDEADHLADLGFLPAVRRILDATPRTAQRLLMSATLDGEIDRLVREYLTEPAVHAVPVVPRLEAAMDHRVFQLSNQDKVAVAAQIAARPGRTLFFVRTKHGADRLAKQFGRLGVDAVAIHGNRNQNQRQKALDAFAAGRPRVLVATDVAARGIHVDDIELVVHFDLPADHKDYTHRSGRTARAGAAGIVLSLVSDDQASEAARLLRAAAVTATSTQVHAGGHRAVHDLVSSSN